MPSVNTVDSEPETLFETTYKNAMSPETLKEAADFYSANYGVYSAGAASPGERIAITPDQLRAELWPVDDIERWQDLCLVQANLQWIEEKPEHKDGIIVHSKPIGQASVARWQWRQEDGRVRNVFWLTHICVHRDHRHQGIADQLIEALWDEAPALYDEAKGTVVGTACANPAAIKALAKRFARGSSSDGGSSSSGGIEAALRTSGEFIPEAAAHILAASPIPSLKKASIREEVGDGRGRGPGPALLDTGLHVQKEEIQQVVDELNSSQGQRSWPALPDGCEYLLIFEGA